MEMRPMMTRALAEALESHTSTHAEQASALMQEMEAMQAIKEMLSSSRTAR